MEPRPADLMCVCIARHVRDGEILAQGLATPLVAAGYLLAWRMHAPHVYFASAIGQSVCREGAPIGLSRVEDLWLERALRPYGFVPAVAEMLPCVRPKEYFRPGQVDAVGRFNNVAIGRATPGGPGCGSPAGGIRDVTTVVDPLDVRQFEFLRGSRRREALELILRFERADSRSC